MKSINYCRCFIMSELKYLASKNGLKYKIVRFEAGPEGKRAKINLDFSHYFRWLFANFRECSLIS